MGRVALLRYSALRRHQSYRERKNSILRASGSTFALTARNFASGSNLAIGILSRLRAAIRCGQWERPAGHSAYRLLGLVATTTVNACCVGTYDAIEQRPRQTRRRGPRRDDSRPRAAAATQKAPRLAGTGRVTVTPNVAKSRARRRTRGAYKRAFCRVLGGGTPPRLAATGVPAIKD